MKYKFNFNTEEEKNIIISNNNKLYLIEEAWHSDENYLIFTDIEPIIEQSIEEIVKEQGNKISILEEENETLKIELSITQNAVNELLFNTLNA